MNSKTCSGGTHAHICNSRLECACNPIAFQQSNETAEGTCEKGNVK